MGGEIQDLTLAHWDRILDVNVRGVIHGVHAVYPQDDPRGSGHIVNTAYMAGLAPSPLLTPYAMTKHAVVGLSVSLRAEAEVYGVNVSVLCPQPSRRRSSTPPTRRSSARWCGARICASS